MWVRKSPMLKKYHDNNWKNVNDIYVNDAGSWKAIKQGWINDAGTWKKFFEKLMVLYNGRNLIIGGSFSEVNPTLVNNIFSISDSHVLNNWYPVVKATVGVGQINVLAVDNNVVYMGGEFSKVQEISRRNLAAISEVGGVVTVHNFNPNPNARISSLLLYNTHLYIGGLYSVINSESIYCLSAFVNDYNITTRVNWNPGFSSPSSRFTINKLDVYGGDIIVAGHLDSYNGTNTTISILSNAHTSTVTIRPFNPLLACDSISFNGFINYPIISDFLIHNTYMYIVGYFNTINTVNKHSVAAINFNPYSACNQISDVMSFSVFQHSNYESNAYAIKLYNSSDGIIIYGNFLNLYINNQSVVRHGLFKVNYDPINTVLYDWGISNNQQYRPITIPFIDNNDFYYVDSYYNLVEVGTSNANDIELEQNRTHILKLSNNNNYFKDIKNYLGNFIIGGRITGINPTDKIGIVANDMDTVGVRNWNINLNTVLNGGIGDAYTFLVSGNNLIIGGGFSYIGNQPRSCVAAISIDTTGAATIKPWAPTVNGAVHTLAEGNGSIYIGGQFSTINDVLKYSHGCVTSNLDISANENSHVKTWGIRASTSYYAGYPYYRDVIGAATIKKIILNDDKTVAYIAGDTTGIDRTSLLNISLFNTDVNGPLSNPTLWDASESGLINVIATYDKYVILGGVFDGLISKYSIEANFESIKHQFITIDGYNDSSVNCITLSDAATNVMFVGGNFPNITVYNSNIIAYPYIPDGNGHFLPYTLWKPEFDSTAYVNAICYDPARSAVFIGGQFYGVTISSISYGVSNMFAVSSNVNQTITFYDNWMVGFNSGNSIAAVNTLTQWTSDGARPIFVGGRFDEVEIDGSYYIRYNCCAISSDTTTNVSLYNWNPSCKIDNTANNDQSTSFVSKILIKNSDLIVVGRFAYVLTSSQRNSIAAFALSRTSTTLRNFNAHLPTPDLYGMYDNTVFNVLSINGGNQLIISGTFQEVESIPRNCIAMISGITSATSVTVSNWNPALSISSSISYYNVIRSLCFAGSSNQYIAIGAGYDNPSYIVRKGIFCSDANPNTSSLLSWSINIQTDNFNEAPMVNDLLLDNNILYMAGRFDDVDGNTIRNIAAVSANVLSIPIIYTDWNHNVLAVSNSIVRSMCIEGDYLYFGGYFSTVNGNSRASAACVNKQVTSSVLYNWNPIISGDVYDITISNNNVILGGEISSINNISKGNIISVTKNVNKIFVNNEDVGTPPILTTGSVYIVDKFIHNI